MSETENIEKITFQAEVQQLLNLVIHSLYSEREVFLRELISNASDACGRLRFESLTNTEMLEAEHDPAIEIQIAKRPRTITIRDNGIGMNRDEVVENIGTIARSGTKKFVEALSGEQNQDSKLIGQFGVGFYSAFMVAEHVTVRTRRAGEPAENGVIWESNGVDGYTIEDQSIEQPGCEIVLTLRKDAKEFLEIDKVTSIIKKYSDHVSLPIKLRSAPTQKSDPEWEVVNDGSAIWTRPKKDIEEEDYNNFYKSLTFDFEDPLIRLHTQISGQKTDYSALMFIPARAPMDLWFLDQQRGVKLYVRRVFVADDADNLMPAYLRFVRGVIDSDDLPLNVSREFLQKNEQIKKIRSGIVRRLLNEIKRIANKDSEKYQKFWNEFGRAFKEGVTEDPDNRKTVSELLRFASTKSDGKEQTVSLQNYVDRMQEKQDAIYYLTAESHASAEGSPHLEVFKKHDIEVLLMSDPVDEWVVMNLSEFAEKPLKSIAKGDLNLDWIDNETEVQADDKADSLINELKKVLDDRVTEVRVTTRLTDSPACLVVGEYTPSRNLSRILKSTGQQQPSVAPILEINPTHPLIQHLYNKEDQLENWAHVLFDQASLSEGSSLENPADYVRRVNALLTDSLGESESVIIKP